MALGLSPSPSAVAAVVAAAFLLGPALPASTEPSSSTAPRLLVLLVVDQGRADYFVKLRPHLSGGLRRVLDRSVRFENAHHAHAVTATGPGHAALVTGNHPRRSGIVGNRWYDRSAAKNVYCVADQAAKPVPAARSPGRSPANLLTTALPDWIKAADPGAKAFAVAGKDRAAILLGGKHADAAFWYDDDSGRMISSSHYLDAWPAWARAFNDVRGPARLFGTAWEAVATTAEQRAAFGLSPGGSGGAADGFPHLLGGLGFMPGSQFYGDFGRSALLDGHVLELVAALVTAAGLGADDTLDYLAVGLSGLDYVGHRFGPNSAEALDTLLRMDRVVGDLLDHLDAAVGADRYVVALSSDHGVMALPEVVAQSVPGARRLGTADGLCFKALEAHLDEKLGEGRWLLPDLYLDRETIERVGVSRQAVELEAKRQLEGCAAVRRVWTRSELEGEAAGDDLAAGESEHAAQYRRAFHAERSPDLFVQLEPYHLAKLDGGTTHGSPYDYDTHVPMLIVAPGLKPAAIDEPVFTVDLAPTLAALLSVRAPEGLDGKARLSGQGAPAR